MQVTSESNNADLKFVFITVATPKKYIEPRKNCKSADLMLGSDIGGAGTGVDQILAGGDNDAISCDVILNAVEAA